MISFIPLLTDFTITRRVEEPEKLLGDYGNPSRHLTKIPIIYPDLQAMEFEIDLELIYMTKEISFAGR